MEATVRTADLIEMCDGDLKLCLSKNWVVYLTGFAGLVMAVAFMKTRHKPISDTWQLIRSKITFSEQILKSKKRGVNQNWG